MGLYDDFHSSRCYFDVGGKSILDIGGGPISLLLRCWGASELVVVDPCRYPEWVLERYSIAGIKYVQNRAEVVTFNEKFDEAWLYNVLQHVQSPEKVVKMAKSFAHRVRVCEYINWEGVPEGHPHLLTEEGLGSLFGYEGTVSKHKMDGATCPLWHGVFDYV